MIQQQVITEFLPRFGYGATVLYCGDSDNKYGVVNETEKLEELGIRDLSQGKLPDIVAYSEEKDWIYLIEAYHTSNPITPERKFELEQMLPLRKKYYRMRSMSIRIFEYFKNVNLKVKYLFNQVQFVLDIQIEEIRKESE